MDFVEREKEPHPEANWTLDRSVARVSLATSCCESRQLPRAVVRHTYPRSCSRPRMHNHRCYPSRAPGNHGCGRDGSRCPGRRSGRVRRSGSPIGDVANQSGSPGSNDAISVQRAAGWVGKEHVRRGARNQDRFADHPPRSRLLEARLDSAVGDRVAREVRRPWSCAATRARSPVSLPTEVPLSDDYRAPDPG